MFEGLTRNALYRVGIYIRLSKEDTDKVIESESITNQRNILLAYLKENKLALSGEYVDDGVSGTTFDRPAFNRLINDIEDGKINMVVTKDLSRLGRDYIQSGYYVEKTKNDEKMEEKSDLSKERKRCGSRAWQMSR